MTDINDWVSKEELVARTPITKGQLDYLRHKLNRDRTGFSEVMSFITPRRALYSLSRVEKFLAERTGVQ